MITLIQIYLRILAAFNSKVAGHVSFNLFQKVLIKKVRPREEYFYKQAQHFEVQFYPENIQAYSLGNPMDDVVVLVHGWNSNIASMSLIAEKLVAKNKRVIGLNLPAHAFYKNSKTNLKECKEAFKTLILTIPNPENVSIISHSFGSLIVASGLADLKINVNNLIFLTSPEKLEDIFLDFKNKLKLSTKTYQEFKNIAQNILHEKVEFYKVSNKLNEFDFNHLYLLHDKNDKIIPYQNTLDIASKVNNSTVYTYSKIGHYKMLWNPDLVEKVINLVDVKIFAS